MHFVPSGDYDLVAEEALAYLITMATLLLTARLVADLHDTRHQKSVQRQILGDCSVDKLSGSSESIDMVYLADLLGIKPVDPQVVRGGKK